MLEYHGLVPDFAAVMYKEGDNLGYFLSCASLLPQAWIIVHLSVFLSRREAQDLWCGMGQILCEFSNHIIKKILKQPRPWTPVLNMPLESHGMPSAHSQFMGYLVGYTLVELYFTQYRALRERVGHAVVVILLAASVAYSRYYLWYHSAPQVLVGLAVGALFGSTWYLVSVVARSLGLVQWCVDLPPCKLLSIKDTRYDVAAEHAQHQKVLAAQKKLD